MGSSEPLRIFPFSWRKRTTGKARLLLLSIADYNHQLVKTAANAGLENQRSLHNGYAFLVLIGDLSHPLFMTLNHRWMDNLIQHLYESTGKDQLRKFCAIDRSVGLDDLT